MLKNFMNSRKSLGKSGILGGLVNRSGGNVEVYDDHWAGKHLKSERTWLVEDLQDLAAEKSVRVTILRYESGPLPVSINRVLTELSLQWRRSPGWYWPILLEPQT